MTANPDIARLSDDASKLGSNGAEPATRDGDVRTLRTRRGDLVVRHDTPPVADRPVLQPDARASGDQPLSRAARFFSGLGVSPLLTLVDGLAVGLAAMLTGRPQAMVLAPVVVILFAAGHLYRPRLNFSVLDQVPSIVGRIVVAAAGLAALEEVMSGSRDLRLVRMTTTSVVLVTAARWVTFAFVRHLRRIRAIQHRTLIVGGGRVAGELAQVLLDHSEYGMLPVGFIDDEPLLGPGARPVPHLGRNSDLVQVIRTFDATNVIVAFGSMRESQVVDVVRTCDRMSCEIFFIPRLYELHAIDDHVDMAWGIPLVRLHRAAFRTHAWRVKRLVDIVGSAVGLMLLAPVIALCALLVRLDAGAGSSIIFRQHRVGVDGRPFLILKFRSLTPADTTESQTRWNVGTDDRVSRIGRLLRKTSLDELPQLWNVLVGDMSLVGPRPERPLFVSQFEERFPRYVARHRVPAGLTGWAQIHGLRGDTSISDRARFDNYYIEGWSLWGDCKILLRTVGQVLRGGGS